MPRKSWAPSPEQLYLVNAGILSARQVARDAGVSHATALRTIEKFKDKVREKDEFKGEAIAPRTAPRREQPTHCWDLAAIREARDDQLRGVFKRPVDMAKHMRTDDALYVAYHARLAPQASVLRSIVPASGVRGKAVAKKATASVQIPGSALMSIHGTLADHGIAIGYNEHVVADGGTRVDFRLTEWPLEHVRYNSSTEQLETPTRNGVTVPIIHGDGRWTIFRKFQNMPWTQEAAVLPGAFVWASHTTVLSDWNQSGTAHGLSKMIGELPAGVPIGTADKLTPDAAAFLRMLQDLVNGNSAAGIRPAGSKTEFVSDDSTAWQIFSELASDRKKAAARIYLGTDAILGSVGGAPGIDIAALFALASSKLQGDFECIEQALRSGVFEPWAAINEGDSRYAPWLIYKLPDTDAIRHAEEQAKKRDLLFSTIEQYNTRGMIVDQAVVDQLAREFGVVPAPRLAAAPKVKVEFAPTQRSLYVFANEARGSDGYPAHAPFNGKTLAQLEAESKASVTTLEETGAPAAAPPAA